MSPAPLSWTLWHSHPEGPTVPSLVHRWLPAPRPGPGPIPHVTVAQTRLEFPHLMSYERWGWAGLWCQAGDWHPVKYDADTGPSSRYGQTRRCCSRLETRSCGGDNEWMKFVWSSFFLCSIGSSITISTRSKITQRALLPSFRSKLESQTVNYHRVSLPELGK